jgi:hypothetical protein
MAMIDLARSTSVLSANNTELNGMKMPTSEQTSSRIAPALLTIRYSLLAELLMNRIDPGVD